MDTQLVLSTLKNYTPKSLQGCIRSEFPSFSSLKRDYKDESRKTIVKILLENLVMQVNVVRGIREQQLDKISDLIHSKYYYLNPAGLKMFCDRFILGDYGKIYDRMDVQTVMDALGLFVTEWLETAGDMSLSDSGKNKTLAGRDLRIPGQDDFFKAHDKKHKLDKNAGEKTFKK